MNKVPGLLLLCFISLSCNNRRQSVMPENPDSLYDVDSVQSPISLAAPQIDFFSDTVPCSDCKGIVYQFFIQSDSSYVLSEEFLGKKKPPYLRFGRMRKTDSLLTLYLPMDRTVKLQVTDTGMHLQDKTETMRPGMEDFTLDPVPNGSFDFSMPYVMDGAYLYQSDGATFTPCGQTISYPVKPGKASFDAEKIFLNTKRVQNVPIYLRALASIRKEKDLSGMDRQMVWMEELIMQLKEEECNSFNSKDVKAAKE